jgi:hypothetical protein
VGIDAGCCSEMSGSWHFCFILRQKFITQNKPFKKRQAPLPDNPA